MQLQLSLGNQFVWALCEPRAKEFIKVTRLEPGYQECNLILTQAHPGPIDIDLDHFPGWAQLQIKSAIRSGQLINTGDKIDAVAVAQVVENPPVKSETKPSGRGATKTK